MAFGALTVIDAPEPRPPRFTLVGSANVVTEPDERWLGGGSLWRYYGCALPALLDPCDPARAVAYTTVAASPTYSGFTVVTGVKCTALGFGNGDAEYRRRLLLAFAASESAAVERELEQGTAIVAAANPALSLNNASAGISIIDAANTSPELALAKLEKYIASKFRAGVIHTTPEVATRWARLQLVHQEGAAGAARLYTTLGTLVVPGSGYQGKAPAGQSANTATFEWAYATGMVDIRRSDAYVMPDGIAQALNRGNNDVSVFAAREYMVTWDDCIYGAVRVDWAA